MRQTKTLVLVVALVVGFFAVARTARVATRGGAPYQDPSRPVPERVADLVGRMTLDEK